jgi:hypothetical protein
MCAKIWVIVTKFSMAFSINMATWVESQVKLYMIAFCVKVFSFELPYGLFGIFMQLYHNQ